MKTDKKLEYKDKLRFTKSCNFKKAAGKISVFKNCSSDI